MTKRLSEIKKYIFQISAVRKGVCACNDATSLVLYVARLLDILTICFYLYLQFDLSVYVQNLESVPQFIIARNIVRYTRVQSLQSIIHTQSFQAIIPFDSNWFNMLTRKML